MREEQYYNIFIVEDDPTYRKMLTHFLNEKLEEQGRLVRFKISAFKTGEEMFKTKDAEPDIVFMDYYLDGEEKDARNGKDIMIALKNQVPGVEVVILSSKDAMINPVGLFRNGAFDYLDKKYCGFVEVQETVSKILTKMERNKYAL